MTRLEMEKLRLPCTTRPDSDFCEVFFNAATGLSIRLRDSTATSTGFNADVDLSEESVRQLFNALGIWLHLPKG